VSDIPITNFAKGFRDLCKDTEIPPTFAAWCGLSGIAIALGRRVWIDQGVFQVFPNMFVVLIAGSGRCRKSTAVSLLKKICNTCEPPFSFISDKITNESLIKTMAGLSRTRVKDEGNREAEKFSEAYAIVDELSTFIDKRSYEAGIATTLIKLYDCQDRFEYSTKGQGHDVIHNPCLGLLGASTMEWVRNAIPSDAIGGGLTSRMILVYVAKPEPPVARVFYDQAKVDLAYSLGRTLEVIATVPEGPAELTPAAWDKFERGYKEWAESNGGRHKLFLNSTLAGYASRRYVHVMSLAILISVSNHPNRAKVMIDQHDIGEAEEYLLSVEQTMPRVMFLINANEDGFAQELVAMKIKECPEGIPRELLLASMSNRMGIRKFDEIIATLVGTKRVEKITGEGHIVYRARR